MLIPFKINANVSDSCKCFSLLDNICTKVIRNIVLSKKEVRTASFIELERLLESFGRCGKKRILENTQSRYLMALTKELKCVYALPVDTDNKVMKARAGRDPEEGGTEAS